jgi:hypothetical protein
MHKPKGACNTWGKPSLIICRIAGEKGKLNFLLPRTAALYIDGGAASAVLTVHTCWHMLAHVVLYTQYMSSVSTLCTLWCLWVWILLCHNKKRNIQCNQLKLEVHAYLLLPYCNTNLSSLGYAWKNWGRWCIMRWLSIVLHVSSHSLVYGSFLT